jgi:hypothetical protein
MGKNRLLTEAKYILSPRMKTLIEAFNKKSYLFEKIFGLFLAEYYMMHISKNE